MLVYKNFCDLLQESGWCVKMFAICYRKGAIVISPLKDLNLKKQGIYLRWASVQNSSQIDLGGRAIVISPFQKFNLKKGGCNLRWRKEIIRDYWGNC